MNVLQKILGAVFPPYKFSVLRKEQNRLFVSIISGLPDEFNDIRAQSLSSRFQGFKNWEAYPDFKYVTKYFPGEILFEYKRHGQNFKLSGLEIFSIRNHKFEQIEILIHHNLIAGLKIANSDYLLSEFDLKRVLNKNVIKEPFEFPPSEIDVFYNSLDSEIRSMLNPDDLFDMDFNNRTFYSFYDLEDGNYLAVDRNQKVYSLVHDAKPMAKILDVSFFEILNDIVSQRFDKDQHLDERYRNSG